MVCEYEDVFLEELSRLPLYRYVDFTIEYRYVDFTIELHLDTSPISMTPHRMEPIDL